MMSLEEFENWSKNLNLTDEAKKEIQRIRNAPPSRRVGGGRYNVSGRYSSRKMGMTIQFESHKVELPTIYMMEFDENVLEYYDQPPPLKVSHYQNKNKKMTYMYTPDFFVIEKEKAYWVECKTEEHLIKLSQEKPDRYFKEDNHWIFAPGRNYAEEFKLEFQVRSSKDINWKLQRNLVFLHDYIVNKCIPEGSKIEHINECIISSPGLTLKELINQAKGKYTIDDIYALICNNMIYFDLYSSLITETENVKVYLNKDQSEIFSITNKLIGQDKKTNKIKLINGNKILWGETVWTILNYDSKNLFLYSNDNSHRTLPMNLFETYISDGYIKGLENDDEDKDWFKKIISQANEGDLKIANEKYEVVIKYLNGEKTKLENVTDRTIRNWVKKYREAKETYGNGYIGLIPATKKKGNRKTKLPSETLELMNEIISNSYETIKLKTAKVAYGELLVKCEELNIYSPSYQTFCETIKKRNIYEVELKRKGKRAAYKYEEFYVELEFTTPKHGERVFEIAHIDHTQLDIELVINGEHSQRPWCTFMMDAFSRRLLAFYLTFEEPSSRSCMMVIRECVRKYNRLPNYLVVDGGKEFNSIYFESLIALYGIHKKERPPAKARFGNVIERLFGITNKLFIHNLQGNTQIMKNVRQVTKSVNPKNHAVWTIDSLYERLDSWINEVYDNLENPSLNNTPREAFEQSISTSGSRPNTYIPYDETFILMTLPSVNGGTRKIYAGKGIKLTYSYYWCEKFRNPKFENSVVAVKYDPFNIGLAYAFINGKWEKCKSKQFYEFERKSEKQMKLITEEIRQKKKLYSSKSPITAKEIARFILESEDLEQKLKLEKNKPVIEIENKEVEANYSEEIIDEEELEIYGELL